jgi:uncharacterized protein YdhG (YjbR/CyaY superfamily)
MAERKRARKGAQKSDSGFTDEERAAMRERAHELKARPRAGKVDGERDVLAKIAEMPDPYRAMGERLHAVIMANGPSLSPKTWYGMPAYSKDGEVVCFFRGGEKFKERYMTLGFNDAANLDEGHLWPVAFALTGVTAAEEATVASLVKKAIG